MSVPVLSRPWHHGRQVPFSAGGPGYGYGVGFSALGSVEVKKAAGHLPDPPGEVVVQMALAEREALLGRLTLIELWLRQARADAGGNLLVSAGG